MHSTFIQTPPRRSRFTSIALWVLPSMLLAPVGAPIRAAETANVSRSTLTNLLPRRKKLIATGWDKPDAARLRANLAEMEKRPFDGVVIEVVGKNEKGEPVQLRPTFYKQPIKQSWFQSSVDDLKACHFTRFTDNFITVGANPGDVDWFDDEGWKMVLERWRVAAWIAKQSGIKGLLFDPEPYDPPHAQFKYSAQAQMKQHTFDEYYRKARQRGQEVMHVVQKEFPGITLFTYFMNSVNAPATGLGDARQQLVASGYGLYPSFIDGWLDVATPDITFVDGCESSYRYNTEVEFLEAGNLMRNDAQQLVSPNNRAKYRAQVQPSFGIYLDAYWNPPTSSWYIDGNGGSRVERLAANTATAARVADEYVWIYGEQFRWWPTPQTNIKPESWEQAIPGSEQALRFARDAREASLLQIEQARKAGTLVNLSINGDFAADKVTTPDGGAADWKTDGAPAGWSTWQTDSSKGTFTWDRTTNAPSNTPAGGNAGMGAARASGVEDGCFIQSYAVKPGEHYAFSTLVKTQGQGTIWIRARWQTPDSKWIAEGQDKLFFVDPTVKANAGGWSEIFGNVRVPEGAGKLVLLLAAAGQSSPQDVAWFDNLSVYKL